MNKLDNLKSIKFDIDGIIITGDIIRTQINGFLTRIVKTKGDVNRRFTIGGEYDLSVRYLVEILWFENKENKVLKANDIIGDKPMFNDILEISKELKSALEELEKLKNDKESYRKSCINKDSIISNLDVEILELSVKITELKSENERMSKFIVNKAIKNGV